MKWKPNTLSTPIAQPLQQDRPVAGRYDFHLIGIGSSVGGLEPLKMIIGGMPTDIPAAIVIVHHGFADAPRELRLILQAITAMPVIEVDKEEEIRPGQIYVPTPGQPVRLRDRVLFVESHLPGGKSNRIIDGCFRTLAYEGREKTIGVILSGTGYDGVEGAKAIERHGGLVIAQDPATARFPMMPISVIANDDPSFILDPEDIRDLIGGQLGK
jgi:two-component system CheB/CheR fusion protein